MKENYNFIELKIEISNLSLKQQLKKLLEAKTDYLQNVSPISRDIVEVSFDEKCNLEIEKIKEIMKLELQ